MIAIIFLQNSCGIAQKVLFDTSSKDPPHTFNSIEKVSIALAFWLTPAYRMKKVPFLILFSSNKKKYHI